MRYIILCLLMLLMVMQPVSADDATLTQCDFNAFASAMNTLQRGGGTLTITCSGTISVPYHQLIRHPVTIIAIGDVVFDGGNNAIFFIIDQGASLTLANITFRNGYETVAGGAIINYGTLQISNSLFEANNAPLAGGAIYNLGTATIQGSKFIDNFVNLESQVTGGGGAILNGQSGEMDISYTTFINNRATGGGAIYNANQMNITHSTFLDNRTANGGGGAIFNGMYQPTNIVISDSFFAGNSAKYGAVIYNQIGDVWLSNSELTGNVAISEAGAIFNNDGTVTITNVLFQDNSAAIAGVINNLEGDVVISQSTFYANRTANQGGALYNNDTMSISNSTFYQNVATDRGGALYQFGSGTVMNITHSTFVDNRAGGGLGAHTLYNYGTMNITHSILSADEGHCMGIRRANIDQTNLTNHACEGARVIDDLLLGEFDGRIIPLLPNSPAIDDYDDGCAVDIDQLGISRPQGAGCDVGAVELNSLP